MKAQSHTNINYTETKLGTRLFRSCACFVISAQQECAVVAWEQKFPAICGLSEMQTKSLWDLKCNTKKQLQPSNRQETVNAYGILSSLLYHFQTFE